MSGLRPKAIAINLGGEEYGLLFSMQAVEEIQEHFDRPVTDLLEILSDPMKMYGSGAYILSVLINANISRLNEDGENRPFIDEKYVGRHLTTGVFGTARNMIFKAFADTSPESKGDSNPQKGGLRRNSPSPAYSISERPFLGFLKRKPGT